MSFSNPMACLALPLALIAAGCNCGERPVSSAPAQIEAAPASLDFGTTAPAAQVRRELTIYNRGAAPMGLSELVIVGDSASSFSVEPLAAMEIAGGDSLKTSVVYAPRAVGMHTARLLIRGDAANTGELAVSLGGVAANNDPCASIQCTTPPGPCYQAVGTCSKGTCSYAKKADNSTCDDGNACTVGDQCQAGVCRGTPKSCDAPPAGSCKDSSSFTAFSSPGTCVAGTCQYSSSTRACAGGCANGVCSGDPCQGVTCNSPPTCFTGGSCSNGSCQYQPNPGATCDDGDPCTTGDSCSATGACLGTPKVCATPPAASCLNPQTSRTYDAIGTCGAAGACSHTSHDSTCAYGCDSASGLCKTGCGPGTHLCSGACVSDTAVATCGASCSPCPTDPNGTASCDGTSCGIRCNSNALSCGGTCALCPPSANGTLSCSGSACILTCAPGLLRCGTGCCKATAVSAGRLHTCALTSDGGVKCWGENVRGELGDNSTTNRLTPVDVLGLTSGATAANAGDRHSCSLTSTGGVKCWGYNGWGQLGDNSTTDRLAPVDVVGLGSGVTAVAGGNWHTCALTSGGGLKCWGGNTQVGLLGDNSTATRLTPVDVVGLTSGAVAVGLYHSCALTSAGGVKCWGGNGFGQLGDGSNTFRLTPVDVIGLTSGVTAIAVGNAFTCAVTSAGGVKCWGVNWSGGLGDNSTTTRWTPVDVVGLASGVAAVVAGEQHTCALTNAGGVKCWGDNQLGQLGDNSTTTRLTPGDVVGLTSGVKAISTYFNHTCALTIAGAVKCWGRNLEGQLGDNSTTTRLAPVDVVSP